MTIFLYKTKNNQGKDIRGEVEADDQKKALSILREKKLTCYSLKEKRENDFLYFINKYFKKVSLSDLSSFTRQMATMVNAGLPLTDALTILSNQSGKLSDYAERVLRDVQGGSTLADAFAKFPKVFSPVYIGLIRAGEAAGVLDNILLRLADNLESQREFRAKIKGAMIYPIIIIIGMFGVMMVMVIFVLPKMMALYKEFDAQLPFATRFLMSFSTFIIKFWWLLIVLVFALVYFFRIIYKVPSSRRRIDSLKFRIPIVGKLIKDVAMTEFARTLGLLVGVGVSLVQALDITSKITNNVILEEGIMQISKQVEKGFSLASSMVNNPVFPQILCQMVTVGEETGKMDEVLGKVSKYFQSESEESLKVLTSAMEPLIMVILGIGVGFLIISVVMPIYNLTSQFK